MIFIGLIAFVTHLAPAVAEPTAEDICATVLMAASAEGRTGSRETLRRDILPPLRRAHHFAGRRAVKPNGRDAPKPSLGLLLARAWASVRAFFDERNEPGYFSIANVFRPEEGLNRRARWRQRHLVHGALGELEKLYVNGSKEAFTLGRIEGAWRIQQVLDEAFNDESEVQPLIRKRSDFAEFVKDMWPRTTTSKLMAGFMVGMLTTAAVFPGQADALQLLATIAGTTAAVFVASTKPVVAAIQKGLAAWGARQDRRALARARARAGLEAGMISEITEDAEREGSTDALSYVTFDANAPGVFAKLERVSATGGRKVLNLKHLRAQYGHARFRTEIFVANPRQGPSQMLIFIRAIRY